MFQLVYASTARELMNEKDLVKILEVSRKNNAELDVTGILLYNDGNFIQALEGSEEAVRSVFAKITKDQRHDAIFVLVEQEVEARQFPSWSMGFQNLKDINPDELPGFSNFFDEPFTSENISGRIGRVQILLETFAEVR